MRVRFSVITFVLFAVLGFAGLLLAAGTDERWTAFSADVRALTGVATLLRSQMACQTPVESAAAFGGVRVWVSRSAPPGPALEISVRNAATGALLAIGRIAPSYASPTTGTAVLSTTLPADRRLSVCVRSEGPNAVTLLGDTPSPGSGTLTVVGKPAHTAMALLFLRRSPKSLLSSLPTVFQRAALFRPGWVGPWTFWLLAGALLVAFGAGALAVGQAVRSDSSLPNDERTTAQ